MTQPLFLFVLCSVLFLPSLVAAITFQITQTTIVSPTSDIVALGGSMVVTAYVLTDTTQNDISVSAVVLASNGANKAFSQNGFTIEANVNTLFTFDITVPSDLGFSTGASSVYINIDENNPWTLLATGPSVGFTLVAASASSTPSNSRGSSPSGSSSHVAASASPSPSHIISSSSSTSRVGASSSSSAPSATPSASNGPSLLFSDDFTTLSIASTANPNGNWMPDDFAWQSKTEGYEDFAGTNWNLNPNDPTTNYQSAFSVSSGILTISSIRTPSSLVSAIQAEMTAQGNTGAVPAWCGGIMISQYHYTGGYLEYRAQWPNAGKGMFPALWMYATNPGPADKGQAEIDLLEMYGAGGAFPTTIYTKSSNGIGSSQQLGPYSLNTTEWHTYGIDRQPSWIRVYVDRELIYSFTAAQVEWFDGVSLSIRLNYAMDARWFSTYGLESDSSTPNPLIMNVDYVKVWATMP